MENKVHSLAALSDYSDSEFESILNGFVDFFVSSVDKGKSQPQGLTGRDANSLISELIKSGKLTNGFPVRWSNFWVSDPFLYCFGFIAH
jgi:hypothetical protein